MLGLILCCWNLEILNNFIFDLVLQMKSGGTVGAVLGLER